jgi:hypothetical protein
LDSTLWIGLLIFLLVIGNGIFIIRRGRKSKKVQSYGHPAEDLFLLSTSALVLIGLMLSTFWLLGPRLPEKGSSGKYVIVFFMAMVAGGLTLVSNRILRHKSRKKD